MSGPQLLLTTIAALLCLPTPCWSQPNKRLARVVVRNADELVSTGSDAALAKDTVSALDETDLWRLNTPSLRNQLTCLPDNPESLSAATTCARRHGDPVGGFRFVRPRQDWPKPDYGQAVRRGGACRSRCGAGTVQDFERPLSPKYAPPTVPPPFTAVVVGTGFIGPVHVEALLRAGVRVAGIVGSTPEKSQTAAERLGLPRGYASLEEVLADDAVDVVHVATPNRLHYEQCRAVIAAGKHVLCEKPLAMRAEESAELVRLAAEAGVAAGVAYNLRHYPLCHEAAERMHGGACGELLHVEGSYVQDWLLRETDFNWRVLAEDGGELRAVADVGTHWLDLVQFRHGAEDRLRLRRPADRPTRLASSRLAALRPSRGAPSGARRGP